MNRDDIDFDLRDIDEDILDLLEDGRQTRQNLAALLDVTGEYIYQRVDLLIKLGVVEKIHDGFYELSESGDAIPAESDKPKSAIEKSDERRTGPVGERRDHAGGNGGSESKPRHQVDTSQLRDELAGSGDVLDRRVEAILDMYDYLVEHGEAEKSDLLGVVDIDATAYASPDSVWSNMVKGRDTLRALDGVETPREGMTTWTYGG